MAEAFDRKKYLESLEVAAAKIDAAIELGSRLAKKDIKRVYLVGCGAPNREMGVIKYWIDAYAKKLDTYLYFPAEFINHKPPRIDEHTIVVLASHSGTTPEIIAAANFLKSYPCITIGVTQKADSPLAQNVQHYLTYDLPDHGYTAKYILLQALVGAIANTVEPWPLYEKVIKSLRALPDALADTIEQSEGRSKEEARIYQAEDNIMLIGSGPNFCTAYVFGICVLMEMQWMHTYACEAAEFFHGPFEVIDEKTAMILLLGEDATRPEAERVVRFCNKHTEKLMIYDSKDYAMKGVDPDVRPIFAPFILGAALDSLGSRFAVWHNHPLTTRRYMWKSEY